MYQVQLQMALRCHGMSVVPSGLKRSCLMNRRLSFVARPIGRRLRLDLLDLAAAFVPSLLLTQGNDKDVKSNINSKKGKGK